MNSTKLQKPKSGVYRIVDLEGREYIGSSVDVGRRQYQHFYYLRNNIHHSYILQNSYNENGKDFFKFEVLEYCHEKELLLKESERLKHNPYYNISGTARGPSLETRRKMSENHADVSGKNNPMFGKKFSTEHRQKISQNHADVSGENNPRSRKVKKICPKTNNTLKVYDYIVLAEEDGFNSRAIASVLSGRTKTSGGFIWEYIE